MRASIWLALILVAAIVLYLWTGTSRYDGRDIPTRSIADSRRFGVFQKTVTIVPAVLVIGTDTVRISEAWLEQRSKTASRFPFGTARDTIAGYQVVLAVAQPAPSIVYRAQWMLDDSTAFGGQMSSGDGVWRTMRNVDARAETLRVSLCEFPWGEEMRASHPHDGLRTCPPPGWLSTADSLAWYPPGGLTAANRPRQPPELR